MTDQVGLVESAAGGALFLDEIGDIPMSVQTTLLRVLQEKEIIRLGESKPRKVDVRIITATHRNLAEAVAAKSFREDLFYRIRVARIEMPPLRQRLDDLPLLVAWFLGQVRNPSDTGAKEFSRDAIEVMMKYSWPGNVRELRSAVESAMIRCHGQIIQPEDLPADILSGERISTLPATEVYHHGNDEAERLREALEKAGGKRAEAARRLGISRSTLYRRLAALHILSDEDK